MNRRHIYRWATAATMVALAVGVGQLPARPQVVSVTVSFIDIGQGDAELIQTTSGRAILVDSGPPAGRDALFDYLKFRGVTALDLVISSHPHRDHIGNTAEVLTAFKTAEVMDSGFVTSSPDQKAMLKVVKAKKIPFTNITAKHLAGKTRNLGDGLMLDILEPTLPFVQGSNSDPNNNSAVVRLRKGNISFLFTGDQEAEERQRLLDSSADLHATVYKVAHHGSHNGTDAPLLDRVKPKEAVISCAKGNSFGHPHKKALDALAAAEVRVWRTDEQGTIKAVTDGNKLNMVALGK